MTAREMKLNVPAFLDAGSGDDSDMSGIRSGQGDTSGYETGETWVRCFARLSSSAVCTLATMPCPHEHLLR